MGQLMFCTTKTLSSDCKTYSSSADQWTNVATHNNGHRGTPGIVSILDRLWLIGGREGNDCT